VPPVDDPGCYHHRRCWAGTFLSLFLALFLFLHLNCLIRN
jgi:hypothetical protein